MTTKKRSLILQYFSQELLIQLFKITIADVDNNKKGTLIKKALKNANVPFTGLGSGTNRMAVLIDGYAVKIALDHDGMIDNKREMLYTKTLQPYVIKVYECIASGLIAVTEFVEIFTLGDFNQHEDDMRAILKEITDNGFLIGDCGVTSKNYVNWGTRLDGSICILDFAYIYNTKANLFVCECDNMTYVQYDDNYFNLICPKCKHKYDFGTIRRRISRKQQQEEIGDIRRLSYNLTQPVQTLELVEDFEPKKPLSKKERKQNSKKAYIKRIIKEQLEKEELEKEERENY